MHKNVPSSAVPKNPIVETTQLFINKRTEGVNVAYSQYGYCTAVRMSHLQIYKVWVNLTNITLSKEARQQRKHTI